MLLTVVTTDLDRSREGDLAEDCAIISRFQSL